MRRPCIQFDAIQPDSARFSSMRGDIRFEWWRKSPPGDGQQIMPNAFSMTEQRKQQLEALHKAITIASPFATQSLVLRHFLARPVMSLHRKKRAAFCH